MPDVGGPQFVRHFAPVLRALEEVGGSARPSEVIERVAELEETTDAQRAEVTESGQPRFDNQVNWARFYLAQAGYIDRSVRGVWTMTDAGREALAMGQAEALAVFKGVQGKFTRVAAVGAPTVSSVDLDTAPDGPADTSETFVGLHYRDLFLQRLRHVSPGDFERFCRRLLLECGFQSVTVTGRSGDGGIDAIGLLQTNRLVSTKVLVQCKRYQGSVGPDAVRDLRGAMAGRSDAGIIVTTGSFTGDARKEAVREGVPPIELVDASRIVELCEELELGLQPVRTFKLNESFFADLNS